MKIIIAAVILALGIADAGFLIGGRYTMLPSSTNAVTRLDRYTGEVSMCVPGTVGGCGFMMESPKK